MGKLHKIHSLNVLTLTINTRNAERRNIYYRPRYLSVYIAFGGNQYYYQYYLLVLLQQFGLILGEVSAALSL